MDSVGRYRITSELGAGTFGRVYRAEDPTCGRAVALKIGKTPGGLLLARRFRAEAKIPPTLRHWNILLCPPIEEC